MPSPLHDRHVSHLKEELVVPLQIFEVPPRISISYETDVSLTSWQDPPIRMATLDDEELEVWWALPTFCKFCMVVLWHPETAYTTLLKFWLMIRKIERNFKSPISYTTSVHEDIWISYSRLRRAFHLLCLYSNLSVMSMRIAISRSDLRRHLRRMNDMATMFHSAFSV